MLAEDFWKCGSNAQWAEAIVSIAGVLNGSTLTYLLGCDPATGKLKRLPSFFIQKGLDILKMFGTEPVIDWYLDQWTQGTISIDDSNFAAGDDNPAFDLSLQGCYKANENFHTQNGTYYLSIVTSKTDPLLPRWLGSLLGKLLGNQRPTPEMNPLLIPSAHYQGSDPFGTHIKPLSDWSTGDLTTDKRRENDGAVSSISQRLPFTAGVHPVSGERIFDCDINTIEKGKWYYERAENIVQHRFDHLDVVAGCKLNLADRSVDDAQRRLYGKLCTLLRDL